MAFAHIDHVATLEMEEVNGVIRKLKRLVRVCGLESTDYSVLLEALTQAGVPQPGTRLVPEALVDKSPFGMLVLAERHIKLVDQDAATCDVVLDYQHFIDGDNQEIAAGYSLLPGNAGGSQSFTQSGIWKCPAGVSEITVECYGGGGSGSFLYTGGAGSGGGGGGGGGGAYASKIFNVVAGVEYGVIVGVGGNLAVRDGSSSYFKSISDVFAAGGKSGLLPPVGGLGGQAADCIGSTTYSGGDGGNGSPLVLNNSAQLIAGSCGGGGGGGAGPVGEGEDGENAVINTLVGGAGGDGGTSLGNGGKGGTGGALLPDGSGLFPGIGSPGNFVGGGAGGNPSQAGYVAIGGNGLVVITWQPTDNETIGVSETFTGNISLYGKNKTSVHQTKTNFWREPIPDSSVTVWNATLSYVVDDVVDYKNLYWICQIAVPANSPAPSLQGALNPSPPPRRLTSPWRLAVENIDYAIPDLSNTRKRQIVVGHLYPYKHPKHSEELIFETGEITVMQAQRNFTIQGHVYTSIPWVIANKIIARINNLPWMDGQAYEWMCTEVAWEAMFVKRKYKMKFEFQHNLDTWLPTAIFNDGETNKPPINIVTGFGVRQIHYHAELDFDFFFQATFEQ